MVKLSRSGMITLFSVFLLLIFGLATFSPVFRLLYPEATPYKFVNYEFKSTFDPIKIAAAAEIAEGDGKPFKVVLDLPYAGPEKVRQNIFGVIVNVKGDFKAYSTVCPHLNCSVQWLPEKSEKEKLWCNCHNGSFDPSSGAVTGGPPPKGLTVFTIEKRGDDIYLLSIGGA
jgi:Rieske Fe-S protein